MRYLLLFLLLILPASAQRKLWTWTPPNQSEMVAHHILKCAVTNTGVAAIVYMELPYGILPEAPELGILPLGRHARAVIVSAKGQIVASADLPPSKHQFREYGSQLNWKILSVKPSKIIMTDGDTLAAFSLKKSPKIDLEVLPETSDFWAEEQNHGTPFFLKRERAYVGRVIWNWQIDGFDVYRLSSVELWSLK